MRSKKRFLGAGRSVYHRRAEGTSLSTSFRLDTREETEHSSHARSLRGRRKKMMHYFAAGGTKQTRRTLADDVREMKQHVFLIVLFVFVLIWIVFYFLPYSAFAGGIG